MLSNRLLKFFVRIIVFIDIDIGQLEQNKIMFSLISASLDNVGVE